MWPASTIKRSSCWPSAVSRTRPRSPLCAASCPRTDSVPFMRDARYDAVADFYDAGFSDPRDPVLAALLDLLGPARGRRGPGLPCGHGRVTREVARLGATVVGVDLSGRLLDKARAQEEREPLGVRYVHGDATAGDPEWSDGSFDAVVCNFGLADIDDLDGAAATVRH